MPTSNSLKKVDVLLICALKDEYEQIKCVTEGLIQSEWLESTDSNGWIVADGKFKASFDTTLSIRAIWSPFMGREQSQAVASQLLQTNSANCIAMSGICAGRRGKVSLGDTIFADRLWSYDIGKVTIENGTSVFQGDMLQYRPSSVWVQRMQAVKFEKDCDWLQSRPTLTLEYQENWVLLQLLNEIDPRSVTDFEANCPNWTEVLNRLRLRNWVEKPLKLTSTGKEQAEDLALSYPKGLPPSEAFQTHVAPIATGAKVVEDANIFSKLSDSMRKVLGLDMEVSALAALGEINNLPVIVAKGVSDFGDSFKDDRYRHFAARASAESLIKLLRSSVDLIKPLTTESKYSDNSIDGAIKLPMELISELANVYPDIREARYLWQKAGGLVGDIEANSKPKDMWQGIWNRSTQGAIVKPQKLLSVVLDENPSNSIFNKYFSLFNS